MKFKLKNLFINNFNRSIKSIFKKKLLIILSILIELFNILI